MRKLCNDIEYVNDKEAKRNDQIKIYVDSALIRRVFMRAENVGYFEYDI